MYYDTWRLPYLNLLVGVAASDDASVLLPCWKIVLLLFKVTHEVLFSFAKASYFALFLQSVVKRFFTALSVLHSHHCSKNYCSKSQYEYYLFAGRKEESLLTCLKPPLLFLSICYQILFEPIKSSKMLVQKPRVLRSHPAEPYLIITYRITWLT